MNIVLDTNVLVSGLLSPSGPPAEINHWIASGFLQLCLDWRILREYHDVLQRPKFHLDSGKVGDFLKQIEKNGIHVDMIPSLSVLPDQSDAMFIEVAFASKAEFLVTGNLRHFPFHQRKGIPVVSPKKFIEAVHKIFIGLSG
jgi:uncharacterized protein